MPPKEGSVDANGLRLHYLEWAPSPVHPEPALSQVEGLVEGAVVLLHATGFLARLWQPVAEELSARYHVFAYDARGHGDSEKPSPEEEPSPYGWDHLVDDFRGFLDALGLRRVLAIGHSMGGATAAHLAATAPEYVAAAVLIEPIVFPPVTDATGHERRQELSSSAARRRMVWPSREELVRSYRSRPLFADWREDVLALYAEHGARLREDSQYELKCPGEIEAKVFEGGDALNTWSVLPQVRCPALVVYGERTERHLIEVAREATARVPNARLVAIPGVGHLSPMERPDLVAAEIIRFAEQGGSPK